MAVKRNNEPTVWFSGTHGEIKLWLESTFEWEKSLAIAHHATFDGMIMERVLGIHPKRWFCTMFGARPILAPFTPNGRVSLSACAEYLKLPSKGYAVQAAIGLRREDFSIEGLRAYSAYCRHDTDLCYALFQHLYGQLPTSEHELIHVTIRKITTPTQVLDKQVLL